MNFIKEVNQDVGVVKAEEPYSLKTTCTGPCFSLGFYDPRNHRAFMLNTSHILTFSLDLYLERMLEHCRSPDLVRAVAVGPSHESEIHAQETQKYIETILAKFLTPKKIDCRWRTDGEDTSLLELETTKGKVRVRHYKSTSDAFALLHSSDFRRTSPNREDLDFDY
jgi:hypothetical protein